MTRVPLELLQHIVQFVAADDLETLKACSWAIPPLRRDLLKALFSQLTITFKFNKKDFGEQLQHRISYFLYILHTNPSYATFICNLRIDLRDVRYLHDESLIGSIAIALSKCESVHRLSLIFERPKNVPWSLVPPGIRAAVEGMLRSGKLHHLDMQSVALPWTALLAPGARPLSLSLGDVKDTSSEATSADARKHAIRISHLKTSLSSLSDLLVEVLEDQFRRPFFELGDLQTFKVEWDAPSGVQNVRKVLFRSTQLRELSINMRFADVTSLNGLFHAPRPPCLSSLESLLCDLSAFFADNTMFPAFVNELRSYPPQNRLKTITLFLSFCETCLDAWEDLRSDFLSVFSESSGNFTEDNFPSLGQLTVVGRMYEDSSSLTWKEVEALKVAAEGMNLPFKFSLVLQAFEDVDGDQ